MKAVTEFASFVLTKAVQTKATLAAEGKTPEEIQTGLGEAFKFEGDKLKHFVNAIDVANNNKDNLRRVIVVTFAEGEVVPPKAIKVEEIHYVPEFIVTARPAAADDHRKGSRAGKGGKGKGRGDKPKSSPWGLSPEEKAAKNKKA